MNLAVKGQPNDRAKGDAAIIDLANRQGLEILSLNYYKNQISEFMLEEGIVTHAISYLMSHGKFVAGEKPTLQISDIISVSERLMNMFKSEFILQEDVRVDQQTITVLKSAQKINFG